MTTFKDWLHTVENSAIGRSKITFALGIGPPMPIAALDSRATINPGLLDLINGKDSGFDQESEDKLDKKFHDKPKIDKTEYVKASKKKAK